MDVAPRAAAEEEDMHGKPLELRGSSIVEGYLLVQSSALIKALLLVFGALIIG